MGINLQITPVFKNSPSLDTTRIVYGRVVDIVLSESHPDFERFGKSLSINGIRYRPLNTGAVERSEDLPFAYQLDSSFKLTPLLNEIVEIVDAPSTVMNSYPEGANKFYKKIVSIWNQTNVNPFPDQIQNPGSAKLGTDILELPKINPLHPFNGNITIEGRHGNTLRFFGYKADKNTFTDDSNNGKPITILRNGQGSSKTKEGTVTEDINKDDSSIYLTSDHKILLKQANTKRTSYFTPPVNADVYKGKQIIRNSDRLFFNAKKDDILLSAIKSVGLNGKHINFDGTDFVSMDGKKVYLGDKGKTEKEWVVLGKQNENWLKDLLDLLKQIGNTLSKLPPNPVQAIGQLVILGAVIIARVSILQANLPTLRSRKVFTE
jgi:hypothetical protein